MRGAAAWLLSDEQEEAAPTPTLPGLDADPAVTAAQWSSLEVDAKTLVALLGEPHDSLRWAVRKRLARNADLDVAARRIAWVKLLNSGQTCIAPDYVLCPKAKVDELVAAFEREVRERYPSLAQSPDYTSIASDRQYARLQGLLSEAEAAGARVLRLNPAQETLSPQSRVLEPTLVLGTRADMRVMREEIFGPILPILPYEHLDEAIAYVNAHDRPLALYHFDLDSQRVEQVLDRTIAGGVTINDCVLHIAQSALPFGGIGPSGIGHYHGHHGFLTFSKQKPVFYQARWSSFSLFKPPYKKFADRLIAFLTR